MIKLFIYIIFVVYVGCFICSCQSKTENIKIVKLNSEVLLEESDVLMKYPYKIKVQDSVMVLWDLHGANKFFHVYSYPELKYTVSFGNKGKGVEEFVNTGGFVVDKEKIFVFDSFKADLYIYSIDSLLHGTTKPLQVVDYPSECIPALAFTKMEDNFVILSSDGKNRITIVDTTGNILEKKYNLPIDDVVYSPLYQTFLTSLWDSFLDYNPKNKVLSIATKLGDVLEIYNSESQTEKIVIGEGGKPDIVQRDGSLSIGKIEGFSDIQVKDKNIYALYSGLERAGESTPEGGKYIHVYNLQGDLEKIYELEQYINGFDVHEDENIVYAISSGNNLISKYILP
ncbi:MAG: TolB-like 6-bladed beta-propeller domain-containing protein [Oscillibacter sp.]|nr:TolB-like 6-bladed beta-propeller domain-containing protein [Oscillibacter sp.]